MFKSVNPYDQKFLAEFAADDDRTIQSKLAKAEQAFQHWKKLSFKDRSIPMKRVAQLLRERKSEHAKLISLEMGKVLAESMDEVEKCASVCEYFAENAEVFLEDTIVKTDALKSLVAYQPLGPVLAIMPWNFPLWQVYRFAAPALMAGNVGLLKHAGNVTQCSLLIAQLFKEAGFPENVFQSLLVDSKRIEPVIANDIIRAVTLTGSEYAGTQVASASGRYLKKNVLELGGSDPFIVLEDADLSLAAKVATQSRMRNAGQSCIAAKRFIVIDKIKDDFMNRFKQNIEALKQGNQLLPGTHVGPLARLDLADDLEKQLQKSVSAGALLVTGGQRDGCNFSPALLDNIRPGMPAFDEEMFGPVAAVITVKTESEAIQMANASRYGLGGSVWTKDIERGERIAREVESGSVFINSLMRSDQRLPFGGIKKSGYGRELSEIGIKEFVNVKTIYIA